MAGQRGAGEEALEVASGLFATRGKEGAVAFGGDKVADGKPVIWFRPQAEGVFEPSSKGHRF